MSDYFNSTFMDASKDSMPRTSGISSDIYAKTERRTPRTRNPVLKNCGGTDLDGFCLLIRDDYATLRRKMRVEDDTALKDAPSS